ncbi:MAG TPA: chorismate-binding protein, partial [Amnibacterium sp.]|nr:chorismate-binding protein [Amnibacterium sp.]
MWLRNGDGIVGIGEAVRLEFRGADRFRAARDAWAELASRAHVEDEVRQRGSGLVAFGTFAFGSGSEQVSTLIVPRTIVGRRGSDSWVTRVGGTGAVAAPVPPRPIDESGYAVSFRDGQMTPGAYRAAVDEALRRIDAGELGKVVLSRDVSGRLPRAADLRLALERFADYPDCWAFAVDGLMGASPETLVTVRGGRLGARVLAGSTARGRDDKSDAAQANALLVSAKDLDEHDYAVVSVLVALAPFVRDVWSSPAPFPLMLPNVWHLASDVDGLLSENTGTLDLLEALHPTAAVAGTPTPDALELIAALEPFDRGRY